MSSCLLSSNSLFRTVFLQGFAESGGRQARRLLEHGIERGLGIEAAHLQDVFNVKFRLFGEQPDSFLDKSAVDV